MCDNGFMSLVSNYYVGKKTKSYKLDTIYVYDTMRFKNTDRFILKKSKNRYETTISEMKQSSILPSVRSKLVQSLDKIKIDYDGAYSFLNELKTANIIDDSKYKRNQISIENIKDENIYFNFDDYGRFHTNFTILRKEIRNQFLSINNEMLAEVDIKNSQPLFFGVLLKNTLPHINGDTKRYFDLIVSGLLYEDIIEKSKISSRKEAKLLMYKILFGDNIKDNIKMNKIFKKIYPSVHEYILEFKEEKKNYKELAYKLQKMESNFLFNVVINEIYQTYPDIVLFTVHDSIMFPKSYQEKVEAIFYKHFKKLISVF